MWKGDSFLNKQPSKCVKQFSLGCRGLHVVFITERGAEGVPLRLVLGNVAFLCSMCSLSAYIFLSVLGAVLILHKLKINGPQHGVSAPTVLFLGWYFPLGQKAESAALGDCIARICFTCESIPPYCHVLLWPFT